MESKTELVLVSQNTNTFCYRPQTYSNRKANVKHFGMVRSSCFFPHKILHRKCKNSTDKTKNNLACSMKPLLLRKIHVVYHMAHSVKYAYMLPFVVFPADKH